MFTRREKIGRKGRMKKKKKENRKKGKDEESFNRE